VDEWKRKIGSEGILSTTLGSNLRDVAMNRVHRGNLLRTDSLQHKSKTTKRLTSRCVIRDRVLPYRQLPIASIYVLPFHPSNPPFFQSFTLPFFPGGG
jgi:hypothetical protein